MKLLVLGATGRTGKWVLKEALQKGYQVHALVRDKSKLAPHPQMALFEGLPTDPKTLLAAMEGCSAVVSVLNISRTSDFPWAPLRTPITFLSDTMRAILSISKGTTLQRVVVCSAWGVAETKPHIPWWFRWTIHNSHIKAAYEDHERQELLVRASNLDWTIVRPAGLVNTGKVQTVKVSYDNHPRPSLTINRRSLGRFMVDVLENKTFYGKLPVISKK